jgi:hypothetical protein
MAPISENAGTDSRFRSANVHEKRRQKQPQGLPLSSSRRATLLMQHAVPHAYTVQPVYRHESRAFILPLHRLQAIWENVR